MADGCDAGSRTLSNALSEGKCSKDPPRSGLGHVPAARPRLTEITDEVRLTGSARQNRSVVMNEEIGTVLGARASTELATSALPEAPVQAAPKPRQRSLLRRLLSMLSARER
jgi:hypothetical protein